MSNVKDDSDSGKVELGYCLMSEEHKPKDLVRYAKLAEDSGFSFASISDHFHPWINQQGQSSFVWNVIGAVANATERLRLLTAVTCPTIRIHPALVAQAAATSAVMMPGRFLLGVGTGENLNEHITGTCWPAYDLRCAMLEEAVEVIRELWEGKSTTHYGSFYVVENAKIYTLPDEQIPILVAAQGPKSAKLAGQIGDGLIATSPDSSTVDIFRAESKNADLPCYAQITVCWDEDEAEARKIAHKQWPIVGVPGELSQDLPTPKHFEDVCSLITEEMVAEKITCGNDPEKHLSATRKYIDAGYKKVMVHQVGPKQEGFFKFYKEKIIPALLE